MFCKKLKKLSRAAVVVHIAFSRSDGFKLDQTNGHGDGFIFNFAYILLNFTRVFLFEFSIIHVKNISI